MVLTHVAAALGLGAIMAMGLTSAALADPDARSSEVIATIEVGTQPFAAALTPDGSRLLVTNRFDADVSVIDTVSSRELTTIPVGIGPVDIVMSPDGQSSYVANGWANTMSVIDNRTLKVAQTFTFPKSPYRLAMSPDGERIFASVAQSDSIVAIDTQSGVVTDSISLGAGIRDIALSPDGTRAYAPADPCPGYPCSLPGKVYVIDTTQMTLLRTIDVVTSPGDAIVAPDDSKWYLTHLNGVDVYSSASNSYIATIRGVRWTGAVAFSPDGKVLYVTQYFLKSMVAIDTATEAVFAKIALPPRPQALVTNPDGSRIYVVSQVDGPVSDAGPGVVSVVNAPVKPPPPPTITATCRATTLKGIRGVECSGITTDIAQGTRLTAHMRTPPAREWRTLDARQGAVVRGSGTFTWTLAVPKQRTVAVYFSFGDVASAPVKAKLW